MTLEVKLKNISFQSCQTTLFNIKKIIECNIYNIIKKILNSGCNLEYGMDLVLIINVLVKK